MRFHPFLVFLVLLLCLVSSCQRPDRKADARSEAGAEADIAAIKALIAEFVELYNSEDFEKLITVFYAKNAILMSPNAPARRTPEAILHSFQESSESDIEHIDSSVAEDVRVRGDSAYAWGVDSGTTTPRSGGASVRYSAKWLMVFERQSDGAWKCLYEMWNENAPLGSGVSEGIEPASSRGDPTDRRVLVYREVERQKLLAHVFTPPVDKGLGPRPAVLLFHGGGWTAGSAAWTFADAVRFAGLGLVAIAVDYRLSGDAVTPVEALDDVRAAFRWARAHAADLGIDPTRVAGYGVSAGGHLVAAAATIDLPGDASGDRSSRPDLLLLWSPALDTAADGWFVKLLQGRTDPKDYSPLEHAGASTPPASIVNGDRDELTPLSKAKDFCERVTRAGGICELNVYPGVGHLLTRNLASQESEFDPDPAFKADGQARHERFLRAHGYIPPR